jgi:hypothetical protein
VDGKGGGGGREKKLTQVLYAHMNNKIKKKSGFMAPLVGINVEEPWGSHYGRKMKGHFPGRQWSPFLCLTFLSLSLIQ